MKSKQIIDLFIAFAIMVSCGKSVDQKGVQQKTSISEKKDSLTYNLDVKLEILKKGINLYGIERSSKEKIPMYLAAISITNLSKDTVNLCYMTCSFEDQLIYEPQILKVRKICDANMINCKFLLQNQKIVFQIYLKKPSQYWYLQNINKLRIGFKIITIVDSKNTHNKIIKDTDLIYWSNYIDLRNYKIAPRINTKDVIIMDSLDNEINNYIEYPYYADY
jgi:hypothetical protein